MTSTFKYKGYLGSIETSTEDLCLHGKILFIEDIITYEAETLKALRAAFYEAVEDYIETCKKLNRKPQTTHKGTFNIRIGPELHKKVALHAAIEKISINEFIKEAVINQLQHNKQYY